MSACNKKSQEKSETLEKWKTLIFRPLKNKYFCTRIVDGSTALKR